MKMTSCLAVLAATLLPVAAFADEGDDDAPTIASASSGTRPGVDEGQLRDPNIDRGFLLPTAETQPAGSISYNMYELLFHGVTYGVTDNLHVSGTVTVPLGEDGTFQIGIASAKYRFLKAGRLRLAAQGSAVIIRSDFDDSLENDFHTFFTGGAIASVCIDRGCNSLISASATTGFDLGIDLRPMVYGVSAVQSVSKSIKLVAEVASAGIFEDTDWTAGDTALVNYGVRFHSGRIAGDVGFVRPFGDGVDNAFPLGAPFVNFTYRAL
jgi:hypothetical protein